MNTLILARSLSLSIRIMNLLSFRYSSIPERNGRVDCTNQPCLFQDEMIHFISVIRRHTLLRRVMKIVLSTWVLGFPTNLRCNGISVMLSLSRLVMQTPRRPTPNPHQAVPHITSGSLRHGRRIECSHLQYVRKSCAKMNRPVGWHFRRRGRDQTAKSVRCHRKGLNAISMLPR